MDKVDKTFKNWFKIMWINRYIQLFVIGLSLVITELLNVDWCKDLIFGSGTNEGFVFGVLGLFVPWGIVLSTGIFGFWKFWKYLTK